MRCHSCHAPIVWLTTRAGKHMPVDAAGVLADDRQFDSTRHISHFATCPNANQHRRLR